MGDCAPMLGCSVSCWGVWQKSVILKNVGRCPQLALVYFLSLQSTYGQSFAFSYKRKLRNALLHSRSGCLQIEMLSSAALLPVTLNTVDDKSILICTVVSIYNGPHAEKDSVEPRDSSDSISDGESRPTQ